MLIAALIVASLSLLSNVYLFLLVAQHYEVWDTVTDKIIDQTRDVVNNHNNRICELELSLGGTYTPFGYKKSEKA